VSAPGHRTDAAGEGPAEGDRAPAPRDALVVLEPQAQLAELIDALRARPLGDGRYEAQSPDWWGGERVFGGLVVAQALNAAVQSADPATPIHSLHGYFLRPSAPGRPIDLSVDRLRDGRTFATRQVTARAEGKETFRMMCSFHLPEEGEEYQLPMPAGLPDPETIAQAEVPIPFMVRELGPTPRRSDGSYESTRRVWLRTKVDLLDDPALHASILAYLSDMTGAAFRPLSLGTWGTHTDASLDHAVWFHRPTRADRWLLYDLHAVVNTGGRAAVRGAMFDREGRLCLTMAQELLIRLLDDPLPQTVPAWSSTAL